MKEITAEIVTTGEEVVTGRIVDTNAVYISRRLREIGITPIYRTTVGDNKKRYREILETALRRVEVVIVTGGLGPTEDDLTREVCAGVIEKKLVKNMQAETHLRKILARYGIRCEESEMRQSYVPEGSNIIPNKNGTAYGFAADFNGKLIAAMSGVPSELEQMFEEHLLPILQKAYPFIKPKPLKFLKVIGISESGLQAIIKPILDKYSYISWGITASHMILTISMTSEQKDLKLIEDARNEMTGKLGDKLFSDEGETLQAKVAATLKEHNLTISLAESCTGGLTTYLLSQVPGISENLIEGAVTYSNDAKIRRLGIPEDVIKKHGAVSEQTASFMSEGIREKSGADIGVGITGIAGPSGATTEKPVGLVYVSVAYGNEQWTKEFKFAGSRDDIQKRAANCALNMVRLTILRGPKD